VNKFALFIQSIRGPFAFTFLLIIQIICTISVMLEYLILGFWAIDVFSFLFF